MLLTNTEATNTMIPEWREFLKAEGADLGNDRVKGFSRAQPQSTNVDANVLCDLSQMGVVSAFGEETASFLQSQLTNDVSQVNARHSQLTAYCNPKGRMLAIFRIFKRGDIYYLRLPQEILTATLKRLRMYVLRAKVTLEDASNTLVRIGYAGPNTEDTLSSVVGKVPDSVDGAVSQDGLTILRVPGVKPRFELYGGIDEIQSIWSTLSQNTRPVGTSVWSLLEILAGIPTITARTVEAFVPQMANLDLIGGLSFDKGCYPGQEIVARTRYLGKLKRRMYRVHVDTESTSTPGAAIYSPGQHNDQAVGTVVDAESHPNGGVEALAVIQIADVEQAHLRLDYPGGPPIELKTLPYEISTPN